jgi:hypothetical protein
MGTRFTADVSLIEAWKADRSRLKKIPDISPEFAVHFVKRDIINTMASTATKNSSPQIRQRPQTARIYPTPPPLSSYEHENNNVTRKKPKMTCENKELTQDRAPGSPISARCFLTE